MDNDPGVARVGVLAVASNTQNHNRYSYVVNNSMKYDDTKTQPSERADKYYGGAVAFPYSVPFFPGYTVLACESILVPLTLLGLLHVWLCGRWSSDPFLRLMRHYRKVGSGAALLFFVGMLLVKHSPTGIYIALATAVFVVYTLYFWIALWRSPIKLI